MNALIIRIAAAVNIRSLYPANHPRVVRALQETVAEVRASVQERNLDSITFLLVGNDLVVEQEAIRDATLTNRQFVDILQRRGVERLTLAAEIDEGEANRLVSSLATGDPFQSTPHVIIGRVQVAVDEEKTPEEHRQISMDQLDIVREAFSRFREQRQLPVAVMADMVWSFVDAMSRTTRAVLPLTKLRDHDQYTFVHSVNVSLLVMAQARSFGIQGTMLHAFGMAALLHDIGKMMVPVSILNKPGKLEGEDWELMQSHAEQGAWYLGGLEGSLPLSALVAFEHHLRFDGQPAYPILKRPRVPNLASRMTSIADAYDAISTVRPYSPARMRSTAIEILKSRIDTFYDPLLVANFARLVADYARPDS